MKMKVPYNIRKSLLRALPFAMLLGTPALNSCKPDPEPLREVTIDWNWDVDGGWAPPKEVIQSELDKNDVKKIFIKLLYENCTGFSPRVFHRARDTLQTRIDLAPDKVQLSGRIFVNSENGAHLPAIYDQYQNSGMSLEDSIWYTEHGCTVRRLYSKCGRSK